MSGPRIANGANGVWRNMLELLLLFVVVVVAVDEAFFCL